MPAMDKAHALVVGVAAYRHVNSLGPQIGEDVRQIYELLVDAQYCGYPSTQVQRLVDGQATGAALRQALADLAARTDADSTVFIYFSGHGGRLESGPHAGEYLLPVDADLASAESLAATAISGAEFTAALRAITARKVVVVFDCCHAAGVGQPKAAAAAPLKVGLPESYYERLLAGRGRVILASSRSDEYSFVLPNTANSLFTHHLLSGLRGGVPGDEGLVRVFDLFEYLQPRVTAEQPDQHPVFKAEVEENFAVALYRGGQKSPAVSRPHYDAYVSYAEGSEIDAAWVWDKLLPRLEAAGLHIAVSDDVRRLGVARVVNAERGIQQATRTLVVLSPAYLADRMAQFDNVLSQTESWQQNASRLIVLAIAPLDGEALPPRLGQHFVGFLDMTMPGRGRRDPFEKLIEELRQPPAALVDTGRV